MALLTLGEEEIIELDMEGMLKVCVRCGGCFLAKSPLWSSNNIPWQLDAVYAASAQFKIVLMPPMTSRALFQVSKERRITRARARVTR